MVNIVLPLKELNVKQRLSSVLTAYERSRLFQTMLEDILSQLTQCDRVDEIIVVSDGEAIKLLKEKYQFTLLRDQQSGLNAAMTQARDHLNADENPNQNRMLLIHGDIPLLTAQAIGSMLDQADDCSIVIVSDVHQQGTNALLLPTPNQFVFHYGVGSCAAHMQEAKQQGLSVKKVNVPELALDIDEPGDLIRIIKELAIHPEKAPKTADYLLESGLSQRLISSNIPQLNKSFSVQQNTVFARASLL